MSDSDSLISSTSDVDSSFKVVSYLSVSDDETWSARKKRNSLKSTTHSSASKTDSPQKRNHTNDNNDDGSPSKRRNQLEFKQENKSSPKTVKLSIEQVSCSPHMEKNTSKESSTKKSENIKIVRKKMASATYNFEICSSENSSAAEKPHNGETLHSSDSESESIKKSSSKLSKHTKRNQSITNTEEGSSSSSKRRSRQENDHNQNSATKLSSIEVLSTQLPNNSKPEPIISSPIRLRRTSRRKSEDVTSDDAETKVSTEVSKSLKKSTRIRSRNNSTNENDVVSETGTDDGEKENDHDQHAHNTHLLKTPTKTPTRRLRQRTPSTKCLESFLVDPEEISPQSGGTRRSARKISQNRRYSYFRELQRKREETALIDIQEEEEAKEAAALSKEPIEKSTTLYLENEDVAGHNLYSFRTPKKRGGMALAAANTPKSNRKLLDTPKTPKTPKSSRNSNASSYATITKTPKQVRSFVKKKLEKIREEETEDEEEEESEGSDFSSGESDDYIPEKVVSSSSDDDDDDKEQQSEHSSSEEEPEKPKRSKKGTLPPMLSKTPSAASSSTRATRYNLRKQQEFILESDGYFSHHTNKKSTTSDRTLDRLKNPRLQHEQLFRLLAAMTLTPEHETAVTEMHNEYQNYFSKWLYILNEGFSILLYGLGSKRNLLQTFHSTCLANQTVLVVNGFFPSLTIKDVLDSITNDILSMSAVSSRNYHEIVDIIEEKLMSNREINIFLLVHNIDGVMLRNHKAQYILSRLAKIEQIHLIASIDHINTPLLWDHTKLSNYNFSWWDATTMLPYKEETAYENSMLVQNSGGLALSSMKNVFLSLTSNSRGIYLIIVKNQVKNKGNSNFQGMPFKELYSRCRDGFLVSSDMALRSQLTEFLDHHLVKMKRTSDGTEHLIIPLENSLLQQFLEQHETD